MAKIKAIKKRAYPSTRMERCHTAGRLRGYEKDGSKCNDKAGNRHQRGQEMAAVKGDHQHDRHRCGRDQKEWGESHEVC